MISPSYLVVRNGWYHLRIRIPQDISEYFPRQEVWKSLKTRDASHAAIIAQRYLSAFKEISALMWSGMIERENISEIISKEIRNLLFSREVAREMNYDWMPEVNLADLANTKLEVCKDALITRDYTKIEAEVMRISASREIERTPKTVEFNIAARQYLHAMIEACKIEIHRSQCNQGLYETTSLSSFQTQFRNSRTKTKWSRIVNPGLLLCNDNGINKVASKTSSLNLSSFAKTLLGQFLQKHNVSRELIMLKNLFLK